MFGCPGSVTGDGRNGRHRWLERGLQNERFICRGTVLCRVMVFLVLVVEMDFVAFGSLVTVVGVLVALGKHRACQHSQKQSCGKQFLHSMNPIMHAAPD